jgi:hypothetical protein
MKVINEWCPGAILLGYPQPYMEEVRKASILVLLGW